MLLFVDNSVQIFLRYIFITNWEDVCHTYHIVTWLKFNFLQMMSVARGGVVQRSLQREKDSGDSGK